HRTCAQHADKDTYSASAEDIEVQSCFLDDQLTNLSPPRNCMPPDVLLRTDISEITRKQSKTGKHGHENGRVYKSRKQSHEKVNPQSSSQRKVKPWSTEVNKIPKLPLLGLKTLIGPQNPK
ncbi:hypothetical protein Tco_1374585, partial [Tanacetum coccineum]